MKFALLFFCASLAVGTDFALGEDINSSPAPVANAEKQVESAVLEALKDRDARLLALQQAMKTELVARGLSEAASPRKLSTQEAETVIKQAVISHRQHTEAIERQLGAPAKPALIAFNVDEQVAAHLHKCEAIASYEIDAKTVSVENRMTVEEATRAKLNQINEKLKPQAVEQSQK